MTEYSIGLDLGGSNVRAAAIYRVGKLLHLVTGHTLYAEGRDAIMNVMVDAIASLRDKQGAEGLAGIGVGVVPRLYLWLEEGVVRNCNNILAPRKLPHAQSSSASACTRPVILENDANAARSRRTVDRRGLRRAATWSC